MKESLVPIFTSGIIGLAAGIWIPKAGERLMAYKAAKKNRQYMEYADINKWRWLYAAGLAISWMAAASASNRPVEGIFLSALCFLMFVITYLDNRYRIIPNESCLIILVTGLTYRIAEDGLPGLAGALGAMAIATGICLIASLLTRGKQVVGAGDVKLLAVCCCLAGIPGFMNVLLYMSLALGVYCIGGLKSGKLKLSSRFPMGGFIAMGLVLSLYPEQIGWISKVVIG